MRKMIRRIMVLSLVLLFLLTGCDREIDEPEISGTAQINALGIHFHLENARGELLDSMHSKNNTMKVYSEEYVGTGSPVDMRWTVEASREFHYINQGADYDRLLIQSDAFSYSARGYGISDIIMGVSGVSVKSNAEHEIGILLFSLWDYLPEAVDCIQLDCIGADISVSVEKDTLTVTGAESPISVQIENFSDFFYTLTLPEAAGPITLDLRQLSEKILTVTDGTGEENVYPLS